jgi:hypothetical protein
MENSVLKNEKQVFYNQVKGVVEEIILDEKFTTVSIRAGHENTRSIAFVSKNACFEKLKSVLELDSKVLIRFYLSSRKKHDRWYTTATILDASITD